MNFVIKCCKGCEQRRIDPPCHGTCPTYIKEKAENEAMMDEYRKRHNIQTRLNSHFFDSVERAEKR